MVLVVMLGDSYHDGITPFDGIYLRVSIEVSKILISRYWRVRHRIKTRESLKRRPRRPLQRRERGRRPVPRRESTSDETMQYVFVQERNLSTDVPAFI